MNQLPTRLGLQPKQSSDSTSNSSHTSDRLTICLGDVLCPACIEVIPARVGKSSVLSLLVSLLVRAGKVPRDRAEMIVKALSERERLGTTGIGNGLALPHLRTSAVKSSVAAVAIAPDGIDFGSLDKNLTKLVMLVLSPQDDRQHHVALMGRLAAFTKDKMLHYLINPEITPEKLYDYLRTQDERFTA